MADQPFTWGTGRRKTSVARVRIRRGQGAFTVNGRQIDEFFTQERDRQAVHAPLLATNATGRYDIYITVKGGGYTGQAGAVVLGIARALLKEDPTLMPRLREGGYLTRDARMKERKKYGRHGARRGFQFSKR